LASDVVDPLLIVRLGTAGCDRMDLLATIVLIGVAIYVVAGLLTGLAFVAFGVTAVQSAPVTVGARVLLLPGATALWPLVLRRWLKARHRR
jgi:hypothetical protein